MTSHYSTINVEKENNKVKPIKLRIYITLYHTYTLLYYKGHIQMKSNHTTINVEKKTNYLSYVHMNMVINN